MTLTAWLAALLGGLLVRLGLIAFLGAALVAPGVMPSRGADGGWEMVICTGDGPLQIPVPGTPDDPPPAGKTFCAFAVAHLAATLPQATLDAAPPVSLRRSLVLRADAAQHLPTRPASPFEARGPPLPA